MTSALCMLDNNQVKEPNVYQFYLSNKQINQISIILSCALISGCIALPDFAIKYNPAATLSAVTPPSSWQAPLPHNGTIQSLEAFWEQYPHPQLRHMISEAEKNAPDVASAMANIVKARSNRISAESLRLPSLQGGAGISRNLQQPSNTELRENPFTTFGVNNFGVFNNSATDAKQIKLETSWEMDLLGEKQAQIQAAKAQEKAAQASWHEARVSIAAEVATSYFNYLACHESLELQTTLEHSYETSAKITTIAYQAGLKDESEKVLSESSLLQSRQLTENQKSQCDIEVKNLKLFTQIDETELRLALKGIIQSAKDSKQPLPLDMGNLFEIDSIPANVLRQRPDLYRAEADLIQAAANIKQATANRLPSIGISGSIGWQSVQNQSFKGRGQVWSLGPLELRLPIFDGGRLQAEQDAAEAQYEALASRYRSLMQRAVYETEVALLQLHESQQRLQIVKMGIQDLNRQYQLLQSREKAGFATKLEVQIVKRQWLEAQKNSLSIAQLQAQSWLKLYRAVGGGWNTEKTAPSSDKLSTSFTLKDALTALQFDRKLSIEHKEQP